MSISQAQFTEAKQEESVSSKLGEKLCLFDNYKRRSSGRIRFSDSPGQPVLVDAKLDDFDLERAAGKGEERFLEKKPSIWSDSVWLDLGGGMEPDDQGWEAIIQSLRHDPTLEQ